VQAFLCNGILLCAYDLIAHGLHIYLLFNRIRKIAFHFKLVAYFERYIIDDYNPVEATSFFSIIFKSDLHSGTLIRTELDTTLIRDHDSDDTCVKFRKDVTVMDIIVFLILIVSSLTYLYSFYLSFRLSQVCKTIF